VSIRDPAGTNELERHLFPDVDGNIFANFGDLILHSAFQPIVDGQRRTCAYQALLRPATLSGAPASAAQLFGRGAKEGAARAQMLSLDRLALLVHLRNYARYGLAYPIHIKVLATTLIEALSGAAGRGQLACQLAAAGIARRKVVFEIGALARPDAYAIEGPEEVQLAGALSVLREDGYTFCLGNDVPEHLIAARLRRLAPPVVKLDRARVHRYADGDTSAVQASLALARELGALTVAKGIETPQQLAAMIRAGVDRFQGHFLGRPAPLSAFHYRPIVRAQADTAPRPEDLPIR
jgi:EAL domain-containing protein (putative c-di-GMP-specific phosphodiesterase class I)